MQFKGGGIDQGEGACKGKWHYHYSTTPVPKKSWVQH